METWLYVPLVSLSVAALLKLLFDLLFKSIAAAGKTNLPPGPPPMTFIGRLKWIRRNATDIEGLLRSLRSKFGPILTLRFGSRGPAIFIFSRTLAHQALVQNGAVFADRPKPLLTDKIISSDQHSINSASYGPVWRLLRRNLTAEILHPSRIRSYSHARKWVLDILFTRLSSGTKDGANSVKVIDHFHYAMFCLMALMCFGDKLDEKQITQIELVHRQLLLSISRFQILNFWPALTRILLRNRWKEFYTIIKEQADVMIPLIRARKQGGETPMKGEGEEEEEEEEEGGNNGEKDGHQVTAYVDTLLRLELQEDGVKRKLTEQEMLTLCSEFFNAGTDTTSTALEWIMANVVKYPAIQAKLFEEMKSVITPEIEEVREEDLAKLPYLKAVVLEALRRHPPGHFVLPHAVTEETQLGGYTVPKNAAVNFMVGEIGLDPEVWEDPMEFRPERFLQGGGEGGGEAFDITGTREIKMMPFGVGRRICPGYGLAMLHLEYFLANLVWKSEWKAVDEVDLAEDTQFTVVMKHPLRAQISLRPEK
ncbi:hypothetical protein Dimus_015037 [Dionaea muscipula]